ncbi:TIR domain-containing protein [Stenotrophomonas maltophilia]|uniref:TIR domain-containing protein n=1 Tax=Stenotrophomonas maltophilia TaxID=40324 RepID=UPI00115E621B|nr:TIR domain-containing protein [Stenotrophomonas maltophilia]
MGYRDRTYVIFDGDKDMWAYAYMLGWVKNERMDFDFLDAHSIRPIGGAASEVYVKRVLRERLSATKQAIVLVGESTKNLYRYVRWEIESCLDLEIPIVVVNLNGGRSLDVDRCPPILRGTCSIHVPFKAKAIELALDDFCDAFQVYRNRQMTDLYFYPEEYRRIGL